MKPKSSPQKQEQPIKAVALRQEKVIDKKNSLKASIDKIVDILDAAGLLGAETKKEIKSLLDE